MGPIQGKQLRLKVRLVPKAGHPPLGKDAVIYDQDTGAILDVLSFNVAIEQSDQPQQEMLCLTVRCVADVEIVSSWYEQDSR